MLSSWKKGGPGTWLVVASFCTLIWASVNVITVQWPRLALSLAPFAETLRYGSWIIFLSSLLYQYWRSVGKIAQSRVMVSLVAMGLVFVLGMDILLSLENWRIIQPYSIVPQIVLLERLALAVAGAFLVDNLYRNTALHNRWSIRLLCLGLAGIFVFDFLFYADAVLSKEFSHSLYEARGAINALVVPLIAVSAARNPGWSLDVFVSRGVVLHSASLIASGIYLLVMGIAGFYLRDLGGRWGVLLQVSFWFGAVMLLFVTIFSGQFRARLRVLVNKHFFSYKYDYREEWLRFIQTLSSSDYAEGLRERVIKAMADIVDSPGGALWMAEEPNWLSQTAVWNFRADINGAEATNSEFCKFLQETHWIIDLDDVEPETGRFENCTVPAWLREDHRAWLIVPLLHHGQLSGFILLERPRATKEMNWEDFDLFKTIGVQVASYLAEQDNEKALAEARQFEAFNQRFAFIIHDIKNLVSQLSLLASNADKHASNPEFQKDMVLTVKESVGRMNQLLTRLNTLSETTATHREKVDVSLILSDLVGRLKKGHKQLQSKIPAEQMWVEVDAVQLETVLSHVISNALDAIGDASRDNKAGSGKVSVDLSRIDDHAVIDVKDNGPGMSREFIREELFKPFKSTKESGYGIGAYESRQLIRNFGGHMGVFSREGTGTTVTVRLPLRVEKVEAAETSDVVQA